MDFPDCPPGYVFDLKKVSWFNFAKYDGLMSLGTLKVYHSFTQPMSFTPSIRHKNPKESSRFFQPDIPNVDI
jgi:hypothetical protein